jgi:hypothetical protein
MTPEQCIKSIRNLPDSRLEAHGVRIGYSYQDGDDSLLLKAMREEYLAKSQWLEFSWLNRVNLSNELTSTWKVSYKPHAERVTSFKRLAEEVYQRLPWMQEQQLTPLSLTLNCEMQICEDKFINSGFFASSPCPTGKRQNYIDAKNYYNALEEVEKIVFQECDHYLLPIDALEHSAASIARDDKSFRHKYYHDYLLQQKRYHRETAKGDLVVIRLTQDKSVELVGRGNSSGRDKRGL